MTFSGVHHTGIIVRNLDRSIYFYHDVLGLEFSNEPSPWFEGEELAEGVGVPGARLRQVCLLAGNDTVELLEYSNRIGVDAPPPQNHLGAMHIALRVEDIDAKKLELEAKGVTFLSEVMTVDEGVLAGWKWVYFLDPDGITLELVQQRYYLEEERQQGIADYLAQRPPLESLL